MKKKWLAENNKNVRWQAKFNNEFVLVTPNNLRVTFTDVYVDVLKINMPCTSKICFQVWMYSHTSHTLKMNVSEFP